ncbi:MAG: hypothetical protein AUI93_05020 [Crenarchaeota archaeon 13_1_40CM_3_52_10]|nr:MAG: hypothetical protein AUI93_05020 [Crenarchaeota archaeon 13_1_40CM_3_52_10]
MADDAERPRKRRSLGGWKFIVAIVLILAYSASAAYGVMSDTSIRGLTVKIFNVSRYCTTNQSLKTLNYNVRGSIWSTSSLQTILSHMTFTLSVDGSVIGTGSQSDTSFGPGQSAPFNLTFTHSTLNPTILPISSKLVLTLSATVSAGLYSATEAASDNTLQTFASTGC